MRTHPTFGNVIVTEHQNSVELALRTVRDGKPVAIFTYDEIAAFARQLGAIRPPVKSNEDDWAGMLE